MMEAIYHSCVLIIACGAESIKFQGCTLQKDEILSPGKPTGCLDSTVRGIEIVTWHLKGIHLYSNTSIEPRLICW